MSKRDTIFPGSDGHCAPSNLKRPHHPGSLQGPQAVDKSAKRTRIITRGSTESGLLDFRLPPKQNASKGNDKKPTKILDGSPWLTYKKVYRVELGGSVAVVYKQNTTDQFTVGSFSATEDQIELISRLNHKNLVCISEVFKFERAFYTISEHTAISLNHCIGCDMPLSEAQLAAIAGQVSGIEICYADHRITSIVP